MNLRNVFGVDVHRAFMNWFYGEYADEFHAKYGSDAGITLVVLDPDRMVAYMLDWEHPELHQLLCCFLGSKEASEKPEGTYKNVLGKLHYCLREDGNSVRAETDALWIRPGDFPWEGAGLYHGFHGGISGLKKEEDWAEFCRCIDKLEGLIKLVNTKAMEVVAAAWEDKSSMPAGMRYFRGVNVSAHFPDMPKAV